MSDFSVALPVFEGPLDLLLELVRAHRQPILEVPLAAVTSQFLAYLEHAGQAGFDLHAEYFEIAARLILIKSRALLPQDPELALRDTDTAEADLRRLLMTRDEARLAAQALADRLAEGSFTRGSDEETAEPPKPYTLWDLKQEFEHLSKLDWSRPVYTPEAPPVSDDQMLAYLSGLLAQGQSLDASRLLALQPSLPHRIALFMACLELARRGEAQFNGSTDDWSLEPLALLAQA